MAMAHTAIEATRSPIITSLTTKSALRNRSEIESDGADGIATPCPATWPRAAEEAKFPTKNRAGPHRSRYRFPAKGVQTRARVPHPPTWQGAAPWEWAARGQRTRTRRAHAPRREAHRRAGPAGGA